MFANYYVMERVAHDIQADRAREAKSRRRWLYAQQVAKNNKAARNA